MPRRRVTNQDAGVARAASGWVLFCQHTAHEASPGLTRRLRSKSLDPRAAKTAAGRRKKWNSCESLRKYWNEKAKGAAKANALARAMCKKPARTSGSSTSTSPQLPDSCKDIKFVWIGMSFGPDKLLGGGAYGKVYQAKTPDALDCAVKTIRLFDDMGPVEAIRDVTREYALQSELATFPYICRVLGLVGVESLHNTMIGSGLMMELCEYPLHKALEQLSGPEHHRQKLLFSLHIASGLLCMHEKKLIHLDLKLDNILLNKHRSATGETSAVISDFGLCRRTDSSHNVTVRKNGVYAASYRCPEATALESDGERCSSRTTTVLSYSADMFAFGCCIYGIVSGRHLIHNVRAYQELCSGSFPEMVPEIVDKFVQRRLDQLFCDESDNLGAIVSSCLKGQALLRQSAGSARADLARKVEQLGTR